MIRARNVSEKTIILCSNNSKDEPKNKQKIAKCILILASNLIRSLSAVLEWTEEEEKTKQKQQSSNWNEIPVLSYKNGIFIISNIKIKCSSSPKKNNIMYSYVCVPANWLQVDGQKRIRKYAEQIHLMRKLTVSVWKFHLKTPR